MARLYYTNGDWENVKPNGEVFTLKELQELVGGYIQEICNNKIIMYVDEEGLMKNLPFNRQASELIGIKIVGKSLTVEENEIE